MRKAVAVLIFYVMSSHAALALDDSRKGFSIGVGAGIHTVSVDNTADDFGFSLNSSSSISEFGIATSFKIGGGITEQFSLYYVRSASWYDDTSVFTTGLAGIGAAYYLSPTAPSIYFHGAVGIGDLGAPFASNIEVQTGTAAMIGVGYEFKPHVMIEGTFLTADVDEAESSTFQLQLSYLWY